LLEDITARESLSSDEMPEDADQDDADDVSDEDEIEALGTAGSAVHRKPTVELIARRQDWPAAGLAGGRTGRRQDWPAAR